MLSSPSLELGGLERDYLVRKELGRGGMGIVYLAKHRSAGHDVAIKLIDAKFLADRDTYKRVEREAALTARIQHPNIVRHIETRRLSGGGVALVRQYVAGETLSALLKRTPRFPFESVASIVADVLSGLSHVHDAGVVHRDVKPGNIFIQEKTGRALLSDFGIARALQGDHEVTLTGTTIGTPAYMAPEQLESGEVDARADLYSLGLVMWEMLCGQRPWEGESLFSLLHKQKSEALPPATLLRPDTPHRFVLALEGALEKEPSRRWRNAREFNDQLQSDQPTPRAIARRERVAKGLREKREEAPAPEGETMPMRRMVLRTPTSGDVVEAEDDDRELETADSPGELSKRRVEGPVLIVGGAVIGALLVTLAFGGFARRELPDAPAPAPVESIVTAPPALDSEAYLKTLGISREAAQAPPPATREVAPSPPPVLEAPAPATSAPTASAVELALPDTAVVRAEARLRRRDALLLVDRADSVIGTEEPALARPARGGADAAVTRSARLAHGMAILDSALALEPSLPEGYLLRTRLDLARGDLRTAWADAEVLARLGRELEAQGLMAQIEARIAERRRAKARMDTLFVRRLSPRRAFTATEGAELARAWLALSDTSAALAALERVRPVDLALADELRDPSFAALRERPRLAQLLERAQFRP